MRTPPHEDTPDPRCVTAAIAFDFEHRSEERLSFTDALRATDTGRFVWLDVLASDIDEARNALTRLDLFDHEVIESALTGEPSTLCGRYESYLHIVISGCKPLGSGFELERVDLLISERVFVTVHRTPVEFLAEVWKDYKTDFVRFARSPSFLVYEVWARLVESYLNVQKIMEERVEAVQTELRAEPVDPGVFMRFSELGADLLHFRKIVRPARTEVFVANDA
jgi:Mg2+ and Co2+ transporter CorA